MFFKYKRNAYFITKQHGLLVGVRAGFMHYSLMKKNSLIQRLPDGAHALLQH